LDAEEKSYASSMTREAPPSCDCVGPTGSDDLARKDAWRDVDAALATRLTRCHRLHRR
jgi:hypothetical protein